jgi:hypothetical protein
MPSNMTSTISQAFVDELDAAFSRIQHCMKQLSNEQVWARQRADMNSIGNLVLHLTGNLKQFILSTIGGEPDDRDRPAEFASRVVIEKELLLERIASVIERAKAILSRASEEELCRVRRFRDADWTGMKCLVTSVAHFRGHTQEVIHQTREILAERYQFAGLR